MDKRIEGPSRPYPRTFNSPLEAGVRTVAVLAAGHPRRFDMHRLVAFDYLLVHTGDVGGPESLHPPVPLHSAELLVRRRLVERALLLMMTRDLVRRYPAEDGILYGAGESAAPFVQALSTEYHGKLKYRANWLVDTFGDQTDQEFQAVMRRFFDKWVEEFQQADQSLGASE